MSSWGFLLYSAFCLSTARLLAGTPAKQTAQSEQRQDTGMAADLRVLTGVFLVRAAVLSSADQAKGLDVVFRSVASSRCGPWLLAQLRRRHVMARPRRRAGRPVGARGRATS